MVTSPRSTDDPRCPQCNEPLQPGSAFCGNCGASVSDVSSERSRDSDETQDTVTYRPLANPPDDTFMSSRESSPWAQPGSPDYDPATATNSTTVWTGVEPREGGWSDAGSTTHEAPERGIRGFFLGLIAVLLIAAVLTLYLYDAWLSESARETVEGWLPWLE